MFSAYFEKLEKKLLKKYKTVKKVAKATTKATTRKSSKSDYSELIDALKKITPKEFTLSEKSIVDVSGVVSKTSDFLVVKNKFDDLESIFDDSMPSELVQGAYYVVPTMNRKNLEDVLGRVSETKKIDQFIEDQEDPGFISTFIVSFDNTYTLKELKDSVVEYYANHAVENSAEFEIMVLMGQGVIIKDWRAARSFIALETKEDTLKWFFVLMNEYLEMEKARELDLRAYINGDVQYNEY